MSVIGSPTYARLLPSNAISAAASFSWSAPTRFTHFDGPGKRVVERVIDNHFETVFGELLVDF
jgi:hypothetical protein